MKIATYGTWDLLHPGHLSLFDWCRRLAGAHGQVVAGVNSDAFVESYKGRPPVMAESDRQVMVQAALGQGLNAIRTSYVRDGGADCSPAIEGDAPDIIAIGADWRDRDYLGQLGVTQEWLDDRGIVVVYVPLLAGHSSTALRERMA